MSAKAPNGDETNIRAIIFREGDVYVAQCLEYDISAQAPNIDALLERIEMTVHAEFASCEERGKDARECICPAPHYYDTLWNTKSLKIQKVSVPVPGNPVLEFAYAPAA